MSVCVLFDNRDNYDFLAKHFEHVIYSPKRSKLFFSWVAGAISAAKQTKSEDTIVCWYDFQAVLLYWILFLTFRKRNIICLNILLKDKQTLKNRIVSYLYKKALASKNFKATVTSISYGNWLNRKLNVDCEYTLLHDVFHSYYKNSKLEQVERVTNSVFCGGRNGRDWNFMFDVAKNNPNVIFNVVLPNRIYEEKKDLITSNMNVKTDIPYSEFMHILCNSNIVCLPLDTESPAGLIVMFQAAANSKLILTTNTVTTQEYINEDRGVLLNNDISAWSEKINYFLKNEDEAINRANNLRIYLLSKCSEEKFVETVMELVK